MIRMKDYAICGIQQIGIGVSDLQEAWKWYINHFGMDCRIFEEESVATLMLPYTGGEPRKRHAILVMNLQSGGGFEIWQYKERKPQTIEEEVHIGDLGIIACKIKVKNSKQALSVFRDKGMIVPEKPSSDPEGKPVFFIKDPYGNFFQLVETTDWFLEEKKNTGGSCGAIIGVSDIERSQVVYSEILGYDKVIYDKNGTFEDLVTIPGGNNQCRRVLLRRTRKFTGPMNRLFGNSEIELVSIPGNPGKKIFKGRFWGDPGFIHLCYDVQGMDALKESCYSKGFPFTVDSKKSHEGTSFDMGEAAGFFSYIEDPDGTLIEFVETHKIPVLKKLGWFIDLRKRNPEKSLPKWILKALSFSRVKN
jgi:catechol 2,3-dioxygenase-like lactoylglutathione lyase family enzyme